MSAEQSHFVFVDVNSYLSLVAVDSSLADSTVVRLEPALQARHRLLSTRFAGNKLVARLAAVAPVGALVSTRVVAVAQPPLLEPQLGLPDAAAVH